MSELVAAPESPPATLGTARWWALAAMVLSTLAVGLDATILSVALPTLSADLHASTGQLQWFIDSYNLVLAAILLPAGLLGDRYGRKRLLVVALAVFGVASALCAYAGSAEQLIAGRVLLALGAAFLMTLPAAILPVIFPAQERSRALTIWITAMFASFPLGPIVGGLLLKNFWWGSVFLINVPVVILAVAAVLRLVPESRSPHATRLDLAGLTLSSGGLVALTFAVIEAGTRGWSDALVLTAVVLALVLLGSFVAWQRGAQARVAPGESLLIDLSIFRNRAFSGGTVLAVTGTFAMFGVLFAGPQYLQDVLGYDPLSTGLHLLPMIAGLIAGGRAGGMLMARFGPGGTAGLGFVLMAAGMFTAATTSTGEGFGLAALWLVIFGLGLGLALPTSMDAALGAIPPERSGMGSGLLMSLRMVGGAVGVAVLGSVFNSSYRSALDLGSQPSGLSQAAHDGPAQGIAAASAIGSPETVAAIQAAFVHAMDVMFVVCGVLAVLIAVAGVVLLPRAPAEQADSAHDVVQ